MASIVHDQQREHLNSNSPWANETPAELLVAICLFNIPPFPLSCTIAYTRTPNKTPHFIRDTINVSHVCARWYNILTSVPILWNTSINLHDHRPEWTNLLLNRSIPCPMTLTNSSSPYDDSAYPKNLLREMQYANRLSQYLIAPNNSWKMKPDWELVPRDWPHLKNLCINYAGPGETLFMDCDPDSSESEPSSLPPPNLPQDFPGQGTPNLVSLHLHGCFVSDPSQISQLSALVELHASSFSEENKIPLKTWHSIIRDLPDLKVISLYRVIATEPDDVSVIPSPIIHCHRLEQFYLKEPFSTCLRVVQCLDIDSKSLRVLSIHCTGDDPNNTYIQVFSYLPFSTLQGHPLFQKCTLGIYDESIVLNGLGAFADERDIHHQSKIIKRPEMASSDFEYGYLSLQAKTLMTDLENIPTTLYPICGLLSKVNIIDLADSDISGQNEAKIYLLFFLLTPNIQHLANVESPGIWHLLYQMTMDSADTSKSEVDSILQTTGINAENPSLFLFPLMETISLVLMRKREAYGDFGHTLFNLCSTRKIMGSPLRYIKISNYNGPGLIPESMTQEMEQLGVDLEVDEVDMEHFTRLCQDLTFKGDELSEMVELFGF